MRQIPISFSFTVVAFIDVEVKMGLMRSSEFFAFKNSVANLKGLKENHLSVSLTQCVVKVFF